jgi:asparagine synthase (glutamine-hydrolysing)
MATPWLRPPHGRTARHLSADDYAKIPLRWDVAVRAAVAHRAAILGGDTLRVLAALHGSEYVAPLGDPVFVDALAERGHWCGPGGRSECMRLLADGLLPGEILERTAKAHFNPSRFAAATREFLHRWDGSGLDERLIDVAALRRQWSAEQISARTAMLLQQAWLRSDGRQ